MTKWLIQNNPKRFDAVGALNELKQIDWRQNINAEVGDVTYIYVAAPVKAIRLKCTVVKLNLPKAEIDDSRFSMDKDSFENYGKYMRLELVEEYEANKLTYEELSRHGLKSVQGPMKITGELEKYIEQTVDENKKIELLDHISGGSINEPLAPKDIISDANGSTYYVCGRCGYKYRMAKRCPDCGQLVKYQED